MDIENQPNKGKERMNSNLTYKHDIFFKKRFISICVYMCAGTQGGQKRILGLLEQELGSCELLDVGARSQILGL